MGIKGLRKFIEIYAPGAIKELTIKDLKNKTIAFDTSIILYQFVIAIRNSGVDLMNNDGIVISHIHAIIMKTLSFLKKNINPVFVFDGKPPDIKLNTLKNRSNLKKIAMLELEKLNQLDNNYDNNKKKIKLFKQSVVITNKQMNDCKQLLHLIGIPAIQSPQESDGQCAYLIKSKLVDAVASDDMDLLTYGVDKLLRNISSNRIVEITLSKILEETCLTQNEFIDLCILLGCDYCPTIRGIGMTKAYALIKKYRNIENIVNGSATIGRNRIILDNIDDEIQEYNDIVVSNDFLEKYKIARNYFLDPVINNNPDEIKWNKPNYEQIIDILENKYSYSPYTIDKLLIKQLTHGYYKHIIGKNYQQLNTHCISVKN